MATAAWGSTMAQESGTTPAQKLEQKPFQFTLFGGLSMPTGTYSGIPGKAGNGANAGLALDYYFNNGPWGIGLDARYQQHKLKSFNTDTNAAGSYVYTFTDGYTTFQQSGKNAFQHLAFSLGPVYRTRFGAFDLNVFARVGALLQQYPEYRQELYALNPFTSQYENVLTPFYTDNPSSKPISLMGLGGARLVYNVNTNLGIVLQADYLSSFGKNGKFTTAEHEPLTAIKDGSIKFTEEPEGSRNYINNVHEYFSEHTVSRSTPITNMNLSLGLQLRFGNAQKRGGKGSSGQSKGAAEAIVMVKDKKTGLALSGVKVQIKDAQGIVYTGITDANGMINTKLPAKDYAVSGDKNGLATTNAQIASSEFKSNNVYKELYHDDERFTLTGETVDCKTGRKVSGIDVMLTQSGTGATVSQISDKDGRFNFQLDPKKEYNLVANEQGKFSQTEIVSTKGLDRNKTLYVTLKLGVCDLKEGEAFVVKNIFYDFDAAVIRSDAALVLDNIVRIMKANPKMTIELSSHTDSRGERQYNQTLSQQRADAAVNYLVSKGIARKRLVAKGYGELKLVNHCSDGASCSEEEHEQNRRTEIQVLKY